MDWWGGRFPLKNRDIDKGQRRGESSSGAFFEDTFEWIRTPA
jgi:hypothetical protein